MFVIKCIPVVGTIVTAAEAVEALIEGDGKKFASKLAQTAVGGVMDAAFVMSGGATSLVTAPLKGGAIEGGKILALNIAAHAASETIVNASESSGGYRSERSGRKSGSSSNGLCFYG